MLAFLSLIFHTILNFFKSKARLSIENSVYLNQLKICFRHLKLSNKKISFKKSDKINFSILAFKFSIKEFLFIVKESTVLSWQRQLIKRFWTFKSDKKKVGRPPVPTEIKNLILKIKLENILWGASRIQGELLKLGISLSTKTIRKILQTFRKNGKIKAHGIWNKFLNSENIAFFATDFFTVDTLLNKTFYVFFIISHSTRRVVQYAVTKNPSTNFVKQQMILFEEYLENSNIKKPVCLIHDNGAQFLFNFEDYGIKNIRTSFYSPNMNAIAERVVRSVRQEALDRFLIFSEKKIREILNEYFYYYNFFRPHQGINQNTPAGFKSQSKGKIKSVSFLGGLHHHYYRDAA